MKIGFCAIWKNKLSEYHATKNDENDTTLKISECFEKANDFGIKIYGLHNIRWCSDNQYFTFWECPSFEILEIIISDLEKAGDFKFAKSCHSFGSELYCFSSGNKHIIVNEYRYGEVLFIRINNKTNNYNANLFCEDMNDILDNNKLISNFCYYSKPFGYWDYLMYVRSKSFENLEIFTEKIEEIKLEYSFKFKIYTGVKESNFRFGRSYQIKNEWAKKT